MKLYGAYISPTKNTLISKYDNITKRAGFSSWLGSLTMAVCFLLAGMFLMPVSVVNQWFSNGSNTLITDQAQTLRIDQIKPGMRVRTVSVSDDQNQFSDTAVDPSTWNQYRLEAIETWPDWNAPHKVIQFYN